MVRFKEWNIFETPSKAQEEDMDNILGHAAHRGEHLIKIAMLSKVIQGHLAYGT